MDAIGYYRVTGLLHKNNLGSRRAKAIKFIWWLFYFLYLLDPWLLIKKISKQKFGFIFSGLPGL
jgi:hypothetical protein